MSYYELAGINSCLNCHYEQVEHLKASSDTCKECFSKDKPDNRYPNWKKVENNESDSLAC